ncbi:hypothetical protein MBM_08590 [Drepanopeziza brunnea f. sp. 'multigermtubi' MB_m1]|uniref:SUZ domain-containing protein n=1 Tax=Marssonina brunnea f. sp. multigermtubi (strain MB_m1) TaxID=1072389 RepID=K1WLP5_MARBU|nr:uncharacterized protein MBM_08590 [Drepanopeziza brunnea f. sp. 'multigermtubi' MB_m1]EKD13147.1 hypothetical protein MBM_08590 [Drepanopeziza brunnea f. sp. 'multigermtubi' MB_m1]
MSKKATIPDAWDDDWESQADKADPAAESTNAKGPEAAADGGVKLTKAERLAQHKENQKKIWENAQEPETPYFLSTRAPVPLTQEFKPALKLLSRKPTPNMVQKIDPLTGLATMTLEDEEEEEEVIKKDLPTAEELRAQREEKQRRYNEARARILGPAGGSMSGSGTPPEGRSGDCKAVFESIREQGFVRSELHAEADYDTAAHRIWKEHAQGRRSNYTCTTRTGQQ